MAAPISAGTLFCLLLRLGTPIINHCRTRYGQRMDARRESRHAKKEPEYAILVSLITPSVGETQALEYLDELEFLASTAGAQTIKRFTQRADHPDHRTFVGKGKLEEIRQYIERHEEVNMVVFDDDLTGKQTNNIEEALKVKIVDRSTLILDIFAHRAQTAQAKTQVELAQMKYLLPRLRGLWTHLERQRGGIGMRGPGETRSKPTAVWCSFASKTWKINWRILTASRKPSAKPAAN
jgi:GTP-binding protein HflX